MMENTKFGWGQINSPAPVWFKKGKKIFSNVENFVIGVLLLTGFSSDSFVLLLIKLISNFLLENVEILLGNGQEFVPSDRGVTPPLTNGQKEPDKP